MARQSVKGGKRRPGLGEPNHADFFFFLVGSIRCIAKGKQVESEPVTYCIDKVVDINSLRVSLEGYSSLRIN